MPDLDAFQICACTCSFATSCTSDMFILRRCRLEFQSDNEAGPSENHHPAQRPLASQQVVEEQHNAAPSSSSPRIDNAGESDEEDDAYMILT